MRTAIQHPEVVRKLVIVSATFSRDGWYPEIVAGMTKMGADSAASMKQTLIVSALCPHCAEARRVAGVVAYQTRRDVQKRTMTGRKMCRRSKRLPRLYLVMPMLSALRMPYSSLSSLAGARRTEAGTDREYPTPGSPFYPV
jgi:pimeloyl-ACP methyl ester carboxylesterase